MAAQENPIETPRILRENFLSTSSFGPLDVSLYRYPRTLGFIFGLGFYSILGDI